MPMVVAEQESNRDMADFDPFDSGAIAVDELPRQPDFDPFAQGGASDLPAVLRPPTPTPEIGAGRQALGRFMQAAAGGLGGALEAIPIAATALASRFGDPLLSEAEERDVTSRPLYRAGRAIRRAAEEAYPVDPNRPKSFFIDTLPQAAGSMAAFMVGGAAGKVAKVSGAATVAALGAGVSGADAFDEAKKAGASDEDAFKVFAINAGLGTTEAIPIGGWLNRLNRASGNKLKLAIKEGSEEAIQEIVQTYGGNLTAQKYYDPNRPWHEGIVEGGGAGFTLGSVVSLLVSGIGGRRARATSGQPQISISTDDKGQAIYAEPIATEDPNVQNRESSSVALPARQPAESVPSDATGTSGEVQRLAAALPQAQPIEAEVARQKLWENMQGREMDIPRDQWEQRASPHLKSVLGDNAPSWRDLNFQGVVTANPNPDGSYRVKLITRQAQTGLPENIGGAIGGASENLPADTQAIEAANKAKMRADFQAELDAKAAANAPKETGAAAGPPTDVSGVTPAVVKPVVPPNVPTRPANVPTSNVPIPATPTTPTTGADTSGEGKAVTTAVAGGKPPVEPGQGGVPYYRKLGEQDASNPARKRMRSVPQNFKLAYLDGWYAAKKSKPTPTPASDVSPKQSAQTKATAKVEAEITSVAKTEGSRSAKEIKAELVQRLESALEDAPAASEFNSIRGTPITDKAKKSEASVSIHIPGDGDFTILNRKENIADILTQAKRISTTAGTPPKPRNPQGVGTLSEQADATARAYGSAENAYRSTKRQRDELQSQGPPANSEDRNIWNDQIESADALLRELYGKTKAGTLEVQAEAARDRVATYKEGAKGFESEIARIEAIKRKTQAHKDRLADLKERYAQNQDFIKTNERNADNWEQQAAKEKAALESAPTPTGIEGGTVSLSTSDEPQDLTRRFVYAKDQPVGDVRALDALVRRLVAQYSLTPDQAAELAKARRVDPVDTAASNPQGNVAGLEASAWAAIARSFNQRIIFVDFGSNPLNIAGAVDPKVPGVIFISARTTRALPALVGHELLHSLRNQRPELYQELFDKLDSLVKLGEFSEFFTRHKEISAKNGYDIKPDKVAEELIAELFQDSFQDKSFWNKLAAKEPTLFRRLATTVLEYLNSLISKLTQNGVYKYFTDIGKAHDIIAETLAEFTRDQGGKPLAETGTVSLATEPTGGVEEEVHRVLGVDMGAPKTAQPMKPIKDFVRENYFNGTHEISEANTERARDLIRRMSDPAEKGEIIKEISDVAGPDMQAVGTAVVNELADYATRLALKGDLSLGREVIRNWHQFGELPAGAGKAAIGRALRMVQEAGSYRFYKTASDMLRTGSAEARKALGVGEELWQKLISTLQGLKINPDDMRLPEVEKMVDAVAPQRKAAAELTERIGKAKEAEGRAAASPEGKNERDAQRALEKFQRDQTEWLKPDGKRSLVQELIQKYLKGGQDIPLDETEFRSRLADDFETFSMLEIQPETASALAREVWMRKQALDGAERQRIMEAEGRNVHFATEQYAQRLANRMELTEWPDKPDQTNEVKRVIAEFLKSQPPLSQTLSVEPLAKALTGVGVVPETATRLAYDIYKKREMEWANARVRAMKQAAGRGNVQSLIEAIQTNPYLAQKDHAWRKTTAENWFKEAGLSPDQAAEAAKMFNAQFDAALKKAAEKEAVQILGSDARLNHTTRETILRAIRSGLLDPANEWYAEALLAKGFKPLNDAEFTLLAELDQKLTNPELSTGERSEITNRIFSVWNRLGAPPPVLDRLASNLVATNLTGLGTGGVNIFAPHVQNFFEIFLTGISSPRDFPQMFKGMVKAWGSWLTDNKFSLTKDAYTLINNDYQHSQNTLKTIWERGLRQIKSKDASERSKGAINMLFGAQEYTMRFLNSLDNANGMVKLKTQLALYTSQAMRHLKFTTQEIRDTVDMMFLMQEQFYAMGIEAGLTDNVAKIRANDFALQHFQDFLDNKVGDTTANDIYRSSELDAYSHLGRLAPGVAELEEGGLFSRFGLGYPVLKLSNWMRRQPGLMPAVGVSLLGYVSVPYRAGRFLAWNSPYGLLRLGIHAWRKSANKENWWKQSLATEQQERFRLKMAISSTVVLAAVTAAGLALLKPSADDDAGDDDDTGVYFTGDGPKNKGLRSAWMARGFKPQSMVFFLNGYHVAIPMNRSGESLAHIGWLLSGRDQKAWRDKEAKAAGKTIAPNITREAAYGVGTYLGLMGQRGFMQTILQAGRQDPGTFAASKGSAFAAGLVTPFLGLQRSVVNLLEGAPDTSSVTSAIMANLPILGLAGDTFRKPLLNRLGDPLYNPENSWYHKMYYTGIPIAIGAPNTSSNQTVYGLMLEKGASPPELRRAALEEKYGPLTNEQFRKFAETSGRQIKQQLLNNEPQLRGMTPEDVKKWMSKTTSSADKTSAMSLGLEPVKPPKPTARSAISAPTSSAAPIGLSVSGRRTSRTRRSGLSGIRPIRLSRSRGRVRRISTRRSRVSVRRTRVPRGSSSIRIARIRRPSLSSFV